MKEILQNSWFVILKNVKVIKGKDRLRNGSRLKETKDMTSKYYVRSDPGPRKKRTL